MMVEADHYITWVTLKINNLVNAKDSLSSCLEVEIESRSGWVAVFEPVVVKADGFLHAEQVERISKPSAA
jgi:hypothetical protein